MEGTIKILKICEISQKYRYQGPRFRELGDVSGQEFREDHLIPWLDSLADNEPAVIDFEGTRVYMPSFLDESFVGAIRQNSNNRKKINNIAFKNMDPIWFEKLWQYIKSA